MLDDQQFVQWCQHLGWVLPTQKYIEQVRNSPPSRRVRSAFCNVSGRYPSRKMGAIDCPIRSHTVSLAKCWEQLQVFPANYTASITPNDRSTLQPVAVVNYINIKDD